MKWNHHFPDSYAGFFPRENAISFSWPRAPVGVLFGRVNGWKLPKIAGNGCARVAAPRSEGGRGATDARKETRWPLRQLRESTPVANYCADVRSMNADVMDGCVEP